MSEIKRRIFFRADGNSQMGLGHVYRCLAISEMLPKDLERIFLIRNPSNQIKSTINSYCNSIIELVHSDFTTEADFIAGQLKIHDIIILDGYSFDTNYQLILKATSAKLVCIDDINNYRFVADCVINHSGGFLHTDYQTEKYTKLFLGPRYAIVRSEFWTPSDYELRQYDNILVCLGGADPNNDLLKVLEKAYALEEKLTYHVVTGSAYKFQKELGKFIMRKKNIKHYENIDSNMMKKLMEKCAIAICSPSTVSFEYMCTGGEIYLQVIADNQTNINKYFISESLAYPFSQFRSKDKENLKGLLKKQSIVFDGNSHERIKEAIIE